MTIRGSAVQEDASSGIWELTETPDGIKLTIARAKGKGKGKYRNFRLEPIDLEDHDSYGDKLQGIVPIKFGGTEDEGTASRIEQQRNQRHAWAKAVIGALAIFPSENPEVEKCSNTASGIAKFLLGMWLSRETDIDAGAFVKEWMDKLVEHSQLANINNDSQHNQIAIRLNSEFLDSSDSQPVIVGQYTLKVDKAPGAKKKLIFVIGATKDGIEE